MNAVPWARAVCGAARIAAAVATINSKLPLSFLIVFPFVAEQ
jgi:hypothetical protein